MQGPMVNVSMVDAGACANKPHLSFNISPLCCLCNLTKLIQQILAGMVDAFASNLHALTADMNSWLLHAKLMHLYATDLCMRT